MLALARAVESGRGSGVSDGASEGRRDTLPSRRPSGLPVLEVKCRCFPESGHWSFLKLSDVFDRIWQDSHYQTRYVYWTGHEVMYGQWFARGMEYPWVGDNLAFR